jgi:adenosylhomocysteine nucleosidase
LVPRAWLRLDMAILFVAAEADELKPFAKRLTGLRKLNWPLRYAFEGIWQGRRVMLAAQGAGPKLAAQAVEVAIRAVTAAELSASRLEAVISVGYCGALTPEAREGQVIVATEVLDGPEGERFFCLIPQAEIAHQTGMVVSQDCVANHCSEKQQLAQSGAIAVDMEAAGVAARTKRANLPFACIKVVTDRADESFALDLNAMRTPEGRIARGKIGVYALVHPKLIPELFRWKRRAESAAQALGDFLVSCRMDVAGDPAPVE